MVVRFNFDVFRLNDCVNVVERSKSLNNCSTTRSKQEEFTIYDAKSVNTDQPVIVSRRAHVSVLPAAVPKNTWTHDAPVLPCSDERSFLLVRSVECSFINNIRRISRCNRVTHQHFLARSLLHNSLLRKRNFTVVFDQRFNSSVAFGNFKFVKCSYFLNDSVIVCNLHTVTKSTILRSLVPWSFVFLKRQ
jgi:hypothetical protein